MIYYPYSPNGIRILIAVCARIAEMGGNMIQYRNLQENEINRELFDGFIRRQVVTKCWRREAGEWVIRDDPFIDDWTEEEYGFLVSCLKNTVHTGGMVRAAFCGEALKGFVSVEAGIFGRAQRYVDLSSIHVSEDMRGRGIGKTLFEAAKKWARGQGADRLYISAHSAVESQAFYKSMGCVEAQEYQESHVVREPYDCQLECSVEGNQELVESQSAREI